MNFLLRLSVLTLLLPIHLSAQQTNSWRHKVSSGLLYAVDHLEKTDILVLFNEKADLNGVANQRSKNAKGQYVYEQLLRTATRSQARALQILREEQADVNSFYIVNALAVDKAGPDLIRRLAELPEVKAISSDPWIQMPNPLMDAPPMQRSGIEWGVERINAPMVWALGYTGQGITVGGADTGYDWLHPAIQPHYRGWNNFSGTADHHYNWHDAIHELHPLNGDTTNNPLNNPCGLDATAPCDDHNHGTHTAGTMTGDDGQGNQIGVAPGAQWVGCRNMERGWGRPSSYLECFQWFLAPTDLNNENADPSKAPHVINNSWYCADVEGCTDLSVNELLRQAVIALKSAGVVVVVSNGNAGSNCGTTDGPPAYFEESFSVGATRPNDTIAGFSSRGPVFIDNSLRVKPNVTAPGANVRSCIRNGGYANFSGTSMAGPHVAGMVALILSAQPALIGQVDAIEDIIEQTAIPTDGLADCSDNGGLDYPNNTYGYGRIDALAAVNQALNWTPPLGTGEAPAPSVSMYPNPVTSELFLDLHFAQGLDILEIFSLDGRTVYQKSLEIRTDRHWIQITLPELPGGMYTYRLSGKKDNVSGKFFKN